MGGIVILDSARVTTEEVVVATRVLDDEMRMFCAAWKLSYWRVYHALASDHIPADHFRHTLLDDSDEHPEWQGWHSSGGFFGNPNATTLTRDSWWQITADHENKEMRANPSVSIWRPWPGNPGWQIAQEVCDPTQADWQVVKEKLYGKSYNVKISNYILPAWFDEKAPPPYDAFNLCKKPGEIRPGGYAVIRNQTTGVRDNVWGKTLPFWARERKAWVARKTRRLANGRAAMLLSNSER